MMHVPQRNAFVKRDIIINLAIPYSGEILQILIDDVKIAGWQVKTM